MRRAEREYRPRGKEEAGKKEDVKKEEVKAEAKEEVKEEVKSEEKEEVKAEAKEEVKAEDKEDKPEVKEETKPELGAGDAAIKAEENKSRSDREPRGLGEFKGSVFAEFHTLEDAKKFVAMEKKPTFHGEEVVVMFK
jgi:hypothetical protein